MTFKLTGTKKKTGLWLPIESGWRLTKNYKIMMEIVAINGERTTIQLLVPILLNIIRRDYHPQKWRVLEKNTTLKMKTTPNLQCPGIFIGPAKMSPFFQFREFREIYSKTPLRHPSEIRKYIPIHLKSL